MLRATPPDNASGLLPKRGLPVSFSSPGTPPGNDGNARAQELENEAAQVARDAIGAGLTNDPDDQDFLSMVRTAEQQAQLYTAQVNRRAWAQSYRAAHNEHYIGSKYTRPE